MNSSEHATSVSSRIIWTPPVRGYGRARCAGDRVDVIRLIHELTGLDLKRSIDIFNAAVPFGSEMIVDLGMPVAGPLPPYLRLDP